MTMETKQLHALSKIYNEKVSKQNVDEGVYDTVKNVMDKGSDFVKNNPVGKVLGKVVAPVKGNTGKKLPTAASQKAQGLRTEENIDEALPAIAGLALKGAALAGAGYLVNKGIKTAKTKVNNALTGATKAGKLGPIKVGGSAKHTGSISSGPFKTESYSDWRQDLKEIPDYDQIPVDSKKSNDKITEKKVKNTVKINPDMKEGKRWQDDDGDGKWYEKSDVDGKISKREKKAKNHNCASKVKHEQFGVGDCISEAHDLDENGNVAHYDVEFEEYIVKGVPVEELQILEQQMHEHVIHEQKKSYETTKRKEVLAALKRDKRPLDKKTKEKIAAKIVKDKGDTSKSDDRYAYESKLWDEVAENLTQLGKLNDAEFRVEGYQRNPEKGEEEERKRKRERKGGYDEKRERRMSSPTRGIDSPAFKEFMRSRGM